MLPWQPFGLYDCISDLSRHGISFTVWLEGLGFVA